MALIKKKKTGKITRNLVTIFLTIWSLVVIFPMVWVLYSSFKSNKEFYESPWALPKTFGFENYKSAWDTANISSYFLNSVFVVLVALFLYLIMTTTSSYILSKYQFRGRTFVKNFYFIAMMIPGVLLLVPLYFQSLKLGMTDKLSALAFLYAVQGVPFGIFILTGFIKRIDNGYIEAAVIDGAHEYQIFLKVIIPQVKAPIFIISLTNVMGSWNEYLMALTFISDDTKFTVPIGISYLSNSMTYRTDYGALFAGLVIAMLPIIILYAIFQRQLQEGTSSGGIKG